MATLVSFHAHPDDEAITTGGTLAMASADGQRVVVVMATRGEYGEIPEGLLEPGESLGERRERETTEAARILGVHRVVFLGYVDSGMMGAATNEAPGSFWRADVEDAARRLAAILAEEGADVLTAYDGHGVSGHPDHIQVHRVGVRAAVLAATPSVYEATMNRDHLNRHMAQAAAAGLAPPEGIDPERLGVPEVEITTTVDVTRFLDLKRRAMAAHASQIRETSAFLAMPDPLFALVWGHEWFIRRTEAATQSNHR